MVGETDLGRLLAGMAPELDGESWGYACVADLPGGIVPFALIREAEGLTVIAPFAALQAAGIDAGSQIDGKPLPQVSERAKALQSFAEHFKDNPLVMDQWFSVQAGSPLPGGLARVRALMQHPAFTLKNPNKVRALVGAFAGQNLVNFHAADGSGYRFLADLVIELNALNPQIASRQLAPLTRWRKYDDARQALMKGELERILASGQLSSDVYEVVSKSLA